MDVRILLLSKAKIGGVWHQPGDELTVDHLLAAELEDAGALNGPPWVDADDASGLPGFDEAVATAAREIANAEVEAAVLAAMDEFEAEKKALRARIDEAESEVRSLQARNFELEAQIADLQSADTKAATEPEQDGSDPVAPRARRAAAKKG